MSRVRNAAEQRPFLFVVGLFIVESAVALPFVVVFNILGLDIVPLRLIIPVAQSVLMVWVVWHLRWFTQAGFTNTVHSVRVYWYPILLAFVPVLVYGSIDIARGWVLFYTAALLFTGVSEEVFARGIAIPALLRRGKWVALLFSAGLFSAGHISNLFFEQFGAVEWAEKFLATFSFAILYGAVFLRTGNIWPLVVLHMVHDYALLTSGTAGPFVVAPMAIELSIGLSVASMIYGAVIVRTVEAP